MSPPVLLGDLDGLLMTDCFQNVWRFVSWGEEKKKLSAFSAFIIAAAATYYFCKGKQINLKTRSSPSGCDDCARMAGDTS